MSIPHEQLVEAARLIRAGRLVAFPTETVYGLGANALDAEAVRRIFEAKGRPPASPLIVHVDTVEMARNLVTVWPEAAENLAARFWPGPLTLVLPKAPAVPDIVTAGLATVGLRMPSHPVALELIRLAQTPIAAPSANRFTGLSPTMAEHVRASLGSSVDMVLDGGPTEVGIESTVLSLAGKPTLLRPGMITRGQLEEVIGPVVSGARVENGAAHPSPGMHLRHYSPRTPLIVGTPPVEGQGVYLWIRAEHPAARAIHMPGEAAEYGEMLYRLLHELDGEGWDWIAIEPPPEDDAWAAIRDRMNRAKIQG